MWRAAETAGGIAQVVGSETGNVRGDQWTGPPVAAFL